MNSCSKECTAPSVEIASPEVKVCERVIMHDVNHVMPVHTKIINKHVFRHTYTPVYTCEEVDVCENVCCPNIKTSNF